MNVKNLIAAMNGESKKPIYSPRKKCYEGQMRKIINIVVDSDIAYDEPGQVYTRHTTYYAVCDDGTVWALNASSTAWESAFPPIPQDKVE